MPVVPNVFNFALNDDAIPEKYMLEEMTTSMTKANNFEAKLAFLFKTLINPKNIIKTVVVKTHETLMIDLLLIRFLNVPFHSSVVSLGIMLGKANETPANI
jgi:hypothetical protein